MTWTIETAISDDVWFEDYLSSVIAHPAPRLPPNEIRIGASSVHWWRGDPGEAWIASHDGTITDRYIAEQIVSAQLRHHGLRRAAFRPDRMHKTADWNDIMAKAKRLIQSGNVTLLRNGFYNIIAHVIGDHGEYLVEISRDDPRSRAITGWQCECPWNTYAWGRTRRWKKFEGRPCSHVMAAYWKALATPLDEQLTQEQAQGVGTGQAIGPKPVTPVTPVTPSAPRVFEPSGEMMPAQGQGQLFPPSQGLPPNVFPPPGARGIAGPPQPAGPDILPPFPGQIPLFQEPGTAPAGTTAPPGTVSVPGARLQSPLNPIQYPGGTYSAIWRLSAEFENGTIVRLLEDDYGLLEGPKKGEYGDGMYRKIPAGSTGEVIAQDPTMGWVEVIFPIDDASFNEPYHARCFLEPKQIEKTRIRPPGPFIRRRR